MSPNPSNAIDKSNLTSTQKTIAKVGVAAVVAATTFGVGLAANTAVASVGIATSGATVTGITVSTATNATARQAMVATAKVASARGARGAATNAATHAPDVANAASQATLVAKSAIAPALGYGAAKESTKVVEAHREVMDNHKNYLDKYAALRQKSSPLRPASASDLKVGFATHVPPTLAAPDQQAMPPVRSFSRAYPPARLAPQATL